MFATPSLCSYEYFFLGPVAHTLLYGLAKQFWALVLRDEAAPHGQDCWIPGATREVMREWLSHVTPHGFLTAVFVNVTCAPMSAWGDAGVFPCGSQCC
jgi:hypothetical protein